MVDNDKININEDKINKTFKINEYLSLRLENNESIIYVKGKRFMHCKYLLLNLPLEKVTSVEDLQSIDEMADSLDSSLERFFFNEHNPNIPPEVEFWGHCSNLQVWYENNYNTGLLHSNLSFPLLKALTDAGDPQAQKMFADEIAKRFDSEYLPVMLYLIVNGYFSYLTLDQMESLEFFHKMADPELLQKIGSEIKAKDVMFQAFKDYLLNKKSKTVKELLSKAVMLRIFELEDEIDEMFELGMKSFPNNEELIFGYIRDLNQRGKHRKAILFLENLVKRVDNKPIYWNGLGLAYMNQKEFQKALRSFKKSWELKPEEPLTKLQLAEAYHATKQPVERDQIIEDLLKVKNLNPIILREIALFCSTIGRIEYFKTISKQVLSLIPYDVELWFELGVVYREIKKILLARRCLKKVINLSNDPYLKSEAYNVLGLLYFEESWNFTKALESLEKSVELNPYNRSAWMNHSPIYLGMLDLTRSQFCMELSQKVGEISNAKQSGNEDQLKRLEEEFQALRKQYEDAPFKCLSCGTETQERLEVCPSCGLDFTLAFKDNIEKKRQCIYPIKCNVLGDLNLSLEKLSKISDEFNNQKGDSFNFTVPKEFLPTEQGLIKMFHPALKMGHRYGAKCLTLSHDEKYIFSGSHELKIWDFEKACHIRTLYGEGGGFHGFTCFLMHDDVLISGSGDGVIRFWNYNTGELLNVLEGPLVGNIQFIEVEKMIISPDNQYLYSFLYLEGGFLDISKRIEVWNLDTKELVKIIEPGIESFYHIELTPDGKFLVGVADWEKIGIVDTSNGQIKQIFDNLTEEPEYDDMEPDSLHHCVVSPDGSYIFVDSEYKHLKKIEFTTGKVLASGECYATLLRLSPDGRYLTNGKELYSTDTLKKVLEFKRPKPRRRGKESRIEDAIFTKDSRYLITTSDSIRIIDVESGEVINTIEEIRYGTKSIIVQDGDVFSLVNDKFFRWNLKDGITVGKGKPRGETNDGFYAPFTGNNLITTVFMDKYAGDHENGGIHIWDGKTFEHLKHLRHFWFGGVDRNGKYFGLKESELPGNMTLILSFPEGKHIKQLEIHPECGQYLAISPTEPKFANSSRDNKIRIYNFKTGKLETTINLPNEVRNLKYSPDGKYLVGSASGRYSQNSFSIWDAYTGNELFKKIGYSADCFGFSEDSHLLATGSSMGVTIWDLKKNVSYGPLQHPNSVNQVIFMNKNSQIATSDDYGNVYIWDYSHCPEMEFEGLKKTGTKYEMEDLEVIGAKYSSSFEKDRLVKKGEYSQLLKLYSHHTIIPEELFSIGYCYYRLGKIEKALEFTAKALNLRSNDVDIKLLYLHLMIQLGKLNEAENQYFELLQELDNSFPDFNRKKKEWKKWIFSNLGLLYVKKKNYKKGLMYYQKALDIDRNFFVSLVRIGQLYKEKGGNNEASEYFNKTVDQIELFRLNDESMLLLIGEIFEEIGEYDFASKLYNKVLDLDENHVFAREKLSLLIESKKQDLDTKVFEELNDNIEILDFSNTEIVHVPEKIKNYIKLKTLNLSHNKIIDIPEELFSMKGITHLDLSNNRLRHLSDKIGDLVNLQMLNLCNNQLRMIPDSIYSLKNLKTLNISNNPINHISEQIYNLKNLKSFSYGYDSLEKVISPNIGFLPDSVEELSLTVSSTTQIPEKISKLKNLKHLILNMGLVWEFPPSFSDLNSLETLELNFKYEEKLWPSILNLKSLKTLILRFSHDSFSFASQEEKLELKEIKEKLINKGVNIKKNPLYSFLEEDTQEIEFKRKFSKDELYYFPRDVEDIEEKSIGYSVEKTLHLDKSYIKEQYEKAPQFGNYILDYGIYLLENGKLVKAGSILSEVCGSENFDNTWPYALFQKARIAAILGEFDFMIQFLRMAFVEAVVFKDVCGGDEKLKNMTMTYSEFKQYHDHPLFKQTVVHDYDNKKDQDEIDTSIF